MDKNTTSDPSDGKEQTADNSPTETSQPAETSETLQRSPGDPSFRLPIQEPRNGFKKFFVVVLVILFILGLGGGAAYFYYSATKKTEVKQAAVTTSPQPVPSKTPKAIGAQELIESIKNAMKSTPVEVVKTNKQDDTLGTIADGTVVYSIPAYQLADYQYSTYPAVGYGIAVSTPEDDKTGVDADYDTAISLIKDQSMTTKEKTTVDGEDQRSALYANSTMVCSIDTEYKLRGYNYTGIACADMTSYQEGAKNAEPFFKALNYTEAQLQSIEEGEFPLTLGKPQITNGLDGYKSADMNILVGTGHGQLFYQAPSKDWKAFMGYQDILPCAKFNTIELKKAFVGTQCYDTSDKLVKVKV